MMIDNINEAYYQVGGSLPAGFPTYVSRKADDELFDNLKDGKFCYVLTARQMGKSSLRVNVVERLRKIKDIKCISVDATSIGNQNTTADQWYYSLLYQIARPIGLQAKLRLWWKENQNLTPVSRFGEFLEKEILKSINEQLIIFIDEIDSMLNLEEDKFSTDDFFALIRSFYNARVDNSDLKRLSFALIGVAAPNDLMKDSTRTPFNIGQAITLENFSNEESKPLLNGFPHYPGDKEALLREILKWTDGQPYLTQKLCNSLAKEISLKGSEEELVKEHVNNLFLSSEVQNEANLSNVNNRILLNSDYNAEMLTVYQQLLAGEPVKSILSDYAQIYLRLSGLVKTKNDLLVIDNLIYKQYFDESWLIKSFSEIKRPFAEALSRWLKFGKSADAALQGKTLEEALNWRAGRNDVTQQEDEFINFSRKTEEQLAKRKNRIIITVISVFLLGAILFAGISYMLKRKAEQQSEMAEISADEARRERMIAEDARIQLRFINDSLNASIIRLETSRNEYNAANDSLTNKNKIGIQEIEKIASQNNAVNEALNSFREMSKQQTKQINELNALVSQLKIKSDIQKDSIAVLTHSYYSARDSLTYYKQRLNELPQQKQVIPQQQYQQQQQIPLKK